MRALTYHGANDVRVDNVPDPIIEREDDIILKVTATAICGSDLHLDRGKIPEPEAGDIFGHEFMYAGFIHGFMFGDAFDKALPSRWARPMSRNTCLNCWNTSKQAVYNRN